MSVWYTVASLNPVSFFFLQSPLLCLPLSTSFSVSSLVAVPCWGESNLNYVSQGPIPLLPAVGISGLLISYQPVIGLRSPSPSDIPQIQYMTLLTAWEVGEEAGVEWWRGVPPACLPTFYSTKCLPNQIDANCYPRLSSCKGIFNIMPQKDYSIFQIIQPARGPAGFYALC